MKFFQDFLGRAPFVFLGVIGIFSIVGNFMILEEKIHHTLDAWRVFTRLIWDFLLGWLFEWIGWELPWWVKDYLTMATVTAGADMRSAYVRRKIIGVRGWNEEYWHSNNLLTALFAGVIWPITILYYMFSYFRNLEVPFALPELRTPEVRNIYKTESMTFFEVMICAVLMIAANYVFVISGAPSTPPVIQLWV